MSFAASAAEAAPVKPPVGWTSDPEAALSLSKKAAEVPHFGHATSPLTSVYRAPAHSAYNGGALYVTRIFATPKPEERDRAVTIELGELDAAIKRAGDNAVAEPSTARTIPDLKLLEGRSTWRDKATGIQTITRMIVAADDKQVVSVTGECVLAGDAAADIVKACNAALASLDPEIPVESRVVLNRVAGAVPTPAPPQPTGSATPGPSMLEGSSDRPALPPMTIPQEQREPDRRPVYVGIGLVVLAVLFYWNRKNREKLERAYEERVGKAEAKRDRDADDLHAAARDEGESGGTKEKTE
jgi:hypothetical protein